MGNKESTLASKQDEVAVGSDVCVSLETFQETVDKIKAAAEILRISFTQVLTSVKDLEKYLSSLSELTTGDDQSGTLRSRGGYNYKTLAFLKNFQTSVAHNETETNKSVHDFLEFAKQRLEAFCQSPTDYGSVSMFGSCVFLDQDVEEEKDATLRNDKGSKMEGERNETAQKSTHFADILEFIKTEKNLLKEKDEIYEIYYNDKQKRVSEMELCVVEMKSKRAALENELQKERNSLEELKKNYTKLDNDYSLMSEQLNALQNKLSKQAATHELEKNNWLQQIKEKEDAVKEKYRLDLKHTSDGYESKVTMLEQELKSKQTIISILENRKEEEENLKQNIISMSAKLHELQVNLNKQHAENKEDEKKWFKSINEKEKEIKQYRQDLKDANEQYKKKMTMLENEFQSEKEKNKDLEILKKDLETLKKNNTDMSTHLNQSMTKLTELCSAQEEEKKDRSDFSKEIVAVIEKNRTDLKDAYHQIKVKEDELKKCREELKNTNKLYSDEQMKTGRIAQELKQYELTLKQTREEYSTTERKLQVSVQKINCLENEIKNVEQTNQVLSDENAVVKSNCQEMQRTIDSQRKDADISKKEYELKCLQFTDEIKILKKRNANLERDVSEMQTSAKQLTEKFENDLKDQTKTIKEKDSTILHKENELKQLNRYCKTSETEGKQLFEGVNTEEKEIQQLKLLHEDQYKTMKVQLDQKEASLLKYITDKDKLELKLKSECEKSTKELQSKDGIISHLESKYKSLLQTSKQESKQCADVITSCKAEIDRQKAEIRLFSEENRKLSLKCKSLKEELDQVISILKERDRQFGLLNQEINELKSRKNQLELQQNKNSEELARFQQNNVKLKADLNTQIEEKTKQNAELRATKEKLEQVNRETGELQQQNSRNNDTIVAIRKEADKSKKEHQIISEEFGNLLKKHEQTVLELAHWKAIKTLKIQLYSSSRGEMLSAVEEELMSMLKSKLEYERRKLEFIQCSKQLDIQPDIPTLLLCITGSRLATNVTHAIHGLTLTDRMALVIFHHKDRHALPSQASERVLTGSELNVIGGIYDFAFKAESGMHSNCQLNNNNFVSLVHFVTR